MENKQVSVAQKLNASVASVLTNKQVIGFEKAFMVASAIEELKSLLTPEYMKPIMAMQGNKLGFKTDKDTSGGYGQDVVKNCLIEAVLMGLQPTGNQFNIIAGNTYATKDGVGELLKQMPGLNYKLNFELPRINPDKTSAAIKVKVSWNVDGSKGDETIEIPVKMNSMMGTDAVIGKATRKARKWLFDYLTGSELPEGEVTDIDYLVVDDVAEKKAELKEKKTKQADAKKEVEKEPEQVKEEPKGVSPEPVIPNPNIVNEAQTGLFNAKEMP